MIKYQTNLNREAFYKIIVYYFSKVLKFLKTNKTDSRRLRKHNDKMQRGTLDWVLDQMEDIGGIIDEVGIRSVDEFMALCHC